MAFSKFIDAAIRDDAVPLYGDGEQTRDFTFVSDAVEATIRAGSVEAPGEAIFNVGGGSNASIATVLSIISSALGRSVRVEHLPPQPGDVRNTSADLSRARDVLGWRPVVSLEDGLRAQVDAARSQA
jgi:UDP-glucose 4-epimerase